MPNFEEIFGHPSNIRSQAHGRVNLIGEHTDYNEGLVLPMQIPQSTRVELAPHSGTLVRLHSVQYGIEQYELGQEKQNGKWIDYVQGITVELKKRGLQLSGFEASIESNVPSGSGVSSSAALEISVLRALRQAFQLSIDDIELAMIAHKAEHDFVGARVGVMDQMVVSLGGTEAAFFLDTKTLQYSMVPLPEAVEIVVLDSGISHANREGEYNTRRSECEKSCQLLGVQSLRDLTISDLPAIEQIQEPFRRRARHVISENERVNRTVAALRHKDLESVGRLFNESHASLRDDYEVSIPHIDQLVKMAQDEPAAYGARITGGGFGGAIVVAVKKDSGRNLAAHVVEMFIKKTGLRPVALVPVLDSAHTS